MIPKPASVLRSRNASGSLQVELLADGGSHREHWYWIADGVSDPLRLLSVGVAAGQPSETAPPWQECSVEDHGAGDVLLAVGRSGRDHWSAAWTCPEDNAIRCEIACRCYTAEAPCEIWLSVSGDCRVTSLSTDRAVMAPSDTTRGLAPFELTPWDKAALAHSETHGNLLLLRAAVVPIEQDGAPVTRQLGFSLRRCER